MNQGNQPPATRPSPRHNYRRALIAVATSAVVAAAVSTPMALRMDDVAGELPVASTVTSTSTSTTATSPTTSTTTTSTTTSVPVHILGETTIREGD